MTKIIKTIKRSPSRLLLIAPLLRATAIWLSKQKGNNVAHSSHEGALSKLSVQSIKRNLGQNDNSQKASLLTLQPAQKKGILHFTQLALLLFLILFPPLAHGAVETWSISIVYIAAILILSFGLMTSLEKGLLSLYTSPNDLGIAVFFALSGISVLYSIYPYATEKSLGKIACYILIYYASIQVAVTRNKLNSLLFGMVTIASILATLSLTVNDGAILGFDIFSTNQTLSLTFANRNHFAAYMGMMAWISIGLAFSSEGKKKTALFVLSSFIISSLFLSLSRGAILSLILSGLFFLVLVARHIKVKRGFITTGVFILLVCSSITYFSLSQIADRFETLIKAPSDSSLQRIEYWKSTTRMIYDNLWAGTGLGTFEKGIPKYQTELSSNQHIEHAHSGYLELVAELGLVGLGTSLLTVSFFLFWSIKKLNGPLATKRKVLGISALTACLSFLVHAAVDFNFHIPSNAIVFAICAAITYISLSGDANKCISLRKTYLTGLQKWMLALVVIFFTSISVYAVLQQAKGASLHKQALKSIQSGNYSLAQSQVNRAIQFDGGNAEHFLTHGDIQYALATFASSKDSAQHGFKRALKFYDSAISLCPTNYYYFMKRAFTLKKLNRSKDFNQALKKATELKPVSPQAHLVLGKYYLDENYQDSALKEFSRTLELNDRYMPSIVDNLMATGVDVKSIERIIPQKAIAKSAFANHLFSKGHHSVGLRMLENIYALIPTEANAIQHVCRLSSLKDPNAAIGICDNYLLHHKKSNALLKYKSVYLMSARRYEQALVVNNILKGSIPADATVYYSLSECYDALDNPEDALRNLKMAIFLNSANSLYHYRYGILLENQGLLQQAYEQFRECLALDSNHTACKKAIKDLQLKLEMEINEILS